MKFIEQARAASFRRYPTPDAVYSKSGVVGLALSHSGKICLGAVLMCASFMLQISCVLFPVLASLLSAACTLFTAAAGILLRRRAILVYLGAGFLTLAFSPRYALEFLLTTGLVGLTLGLLTANKKAHPLLISGLGMFCGLCSLTYLLGAAAFGGVFAGLPLIACLPVFAVFSAAYPALCRYALKHVMNQRILRLSGMNYE